LSARIDLTGKRFGRLKVLAFAGLTANREARGMGISCDRLWIAAAARAKI
jgi:hypothetical protein